jgi:SAM-dependent methyltransferase
MLVERHRDAYGQMLLAAFEDDDVVEIVERDDGFISASAMGPKLYLAPFRRRPSHHRRAMRFVRGRVLDVGAGGGRVSLHLQERGHEVVAIDNSPEAVEVCPRRGVRDARLLGFDEVDDALGTFDTIILLGNNFGRGRATNLRRTSTRSARPRVTNTSRPCAKCTGTAISRRSPDCQRS